LFVGGISIRFALPALVYAVGWLVSLAWRPAAWIGMALAALLALAVWAPLISLVELALGFDLPFVFSILTALMLLTWLASIGAAFGYDGALRNAAAVAGVAALASVAISAIVPDISVERPRSLNISYFLDTAGDRARIIAGTAERALPAEFAGAFEPESILPGDRFETWATPAPVEQVAPPTFQDVTTTEAEGERVISARLVMNGAYRAMLRIPLDARPLLVRVNGVQTDFADTGGERRDYMSLACQGRACDGAVVEIVTESAETDADWYVIGQFPSRASPAAEAMRARRPPTATPIQFGDSVVTLSRFDR
ncbi:MAG: hypothetical protein AB7T58_16740, partial [Hyphomonadaceae bacterium]